MTKSKSTHAGRMAVLDFLREEGIQIVPVPHGDRKTGGQIVVMLGDGTWLEFDTQKQVVDWLAEHMERRGLKVHDPSKSRASRRNPSPYEPRRDVLRMGKHGDYTMAKPRKSASRGRTLGELSVGGLLIHKEHTGHAKPSYVVRTITGEWKGAASTKEAAEAIRSSHLPDSLKVSNPSRNHPPELPVGAEPVAYELANAVRSLLPEKEQLVEHLKKTSRRSDFDREKYAEFLAKTWVMPAAMRYYRNDADAKRYATLPVRRLAGEIYVDHVLDGEWA